MNGINMNLFLGDASRFNTNKKINDNKSTFSGKVAGTKKTQEKSATVDITGQSREVKQAGYNKPKMKIQKDETAFKVVDKDGIQEGVELSEAAKNLLNTLKEKYGNMDFYIADTSSDEEASYYMDQGQKEYSVLIDPETLEKMAADEDVLTKYQNILDGTGEMFDTIKEEVGKDDMKYVGSINVSFDKDGNTSYIVEILDNMNANKGNNHTNNQKTTKVKASSKEDLVTKIKEKIAEKKELEKKEAEKKEKTAKESK